MNLYTSLTLRYLKQNKKRTLVTIIGIILSTALICGIGNICMSIMDYEIRDTIQYSSGFYSTFSDINKKQADVVTKSAEITKYGYINEVGDTILDKDKNILLSINSFNKTTFENYNLSLKEGNFPKNEDEIVLSETTLKYIDKKIGDKISFDIGESEYNDDGELLNLKNSNKKTYTIVGILNKPKFEYSTTLSAITGFDINSKTNKDKFSVAIATKKPKDIYITSIKIGEKIGLAHSSVENKDDYYYSNEAGMYYKNIEFNEHLLRLLGASAYEGVNITMMSIIILITSLVIICTIATIYNSFSISISERKKQFGILNSIGATKSQIMKLVFLEGLLVSIVSIPLGLLSGTLAIDIVFKVIRTLFTTSMFGELDLRVVFSPLVLICSTIIILLTILISAIIPARDAARISPLEAIRNSSKLKVGKVKNSKLVKALFKTEGLLAYKNLRRNKGRFRITLFSLVISIVIFISFNGFMDMFLEANSVQSGVSTYDLRLYKTKENADIDGYINEIKNLDGIKDIAYYDNYSMKIDINEKHINQDVKDTLENNGSAEIKGSTYTLLNNNISFPGDISLSNIKLSDGKFDRETAKKENGVILVRYSYQESLAKKKKVKLTDYKVGDTIKATVMLYDNEGNETKKEIDLKILGITDDVLTGDSQYTTNGYNVVGYNDLKDKLGIKDKVNYFYVNTDKSEQVRADIKKIAEKYLLGFSDQIEEAQQIEQTMNVMKIFVYGFIVVISLVSVTNIVNTMSTNINLRKREFAIIKSIGVTPSGFNKIIYMESILYGILSLMYGIPIGIILSILMNKILSRMITVQSIIPYKSILICIVCVMIITFVSSYIPMKKINKENIIDNIRQESI